MLSIDITDSQIKLIRSFSNGNKIKVTHSVIKNISRELISNGYINDVPLLAGEISEILTDFKIKDKNVILTINSSSIVNKDILIPKFKKSQYKSVVNNIIQAELGVSLDYNITFKILGEAVFEDTKSLIKIIATACPQKLIESYRQLCNQLGLKVNHIITTDASIWRLISKFPELKKEMPLLTVQVDNNFLSFNLFENNQVVFTRYIPINMEDYGYSNDYLKTALYDNLFRILQFNKVRPGASAIKQIYLYGQLEDPESFISTVQGFGINVQLIPSSSNVVSPSGFDFKSYVNSLGAMLKADKVLENVDLLTYTGPKPSNDTPRVFILLLIMILVVSGGSIYGVFMYQENIKIDYSNKIASVENSIRSMRLKEKQVELNTKLSTYNRINEYKTEIEKAVTIFKFYPKITNNVLLELEKNLGKNVIINNISVSGSNLSVSYTAKTDYAPSEYVKALNEQNFFYNIVYTGYNGQIQVDENGNELSKSYNFSLTMMIR